MIEVVYNTNDGFKELRLVPDGLPASFYSRGIFIGPPKRLQSLGTDVDVELYNYLSSERVLDYNDLDRAKLLRFLEKHSDNPRHIRLLVIGVYQKEREHG